MCNVDAVFVITCFFTPCPQPTAAVEDMEKFVARDRLDNQTASTAAGVPDISPGSKRSGKVQTDDGSEAQPPAAKKLKMLSEDRTRYRAHANMSHLLRGPRYVHVTMRSWHLPLS